MTLMILAGVWALAYGHITLTQSFKMKGNEARIFGIVLLAVAAFGLPHINAWLGSHVHLPKFVASNEALRAAYDLLVGAAVTYAAGWVMTRGLPKLRIPVISVSLKRLRA